MSHTFKKPRMRDWRLIRVIRRVDDEVSNLITASDLTEIKGIGSKRARILDLAGVKNFSDLAKSSIPILSSKTGIPEQFFLNWIKQAKDLVN